jgi:DNA polymerase III sliding clamp (beta) subunit (PCNA family)
MLMNREHFIRVLESVSPGLSTREVIEQSSCFVFTEGKVQTFNDEVSCSYPFDSEIVGAVQAAPLLAILKKLAEDEIEVIATETELRIKGKRKQAGIAMESEVRLPVAEVEQPTKWADLNPVFLEAVNVTLVSVNKKSEGFIEKCIHITPEWMEACDNIQLTRYPLETGLQTSMLVRGESVKQIAPLGMNKICETDSWLHFKNPDGLILSCRKYIEDFPDLAGLLEVSGTKVKLPKGLKEAIERAEVFSVENADDNVVKIDLTEGKVRIKSEGVSGWFSETKKIRYNGKPLSFMISPKLLSTITKDHNECVVTKNRLMIDGGAFTYVTCLGVVGE